MQQPPTHAPPQVDPKAQTLAAASRLLPELDFLHVVTMRPSEVCLVARHRPSTETPEPSAFIVYLFRPVSDPAHLQHFRESAAKLMQVEHPSLGIPHHFGTAANHPYFFVEIPPGSSLTQLQNARQLQPAHVVHVIPEVCAALEAAHQQGVNHHSLTPDDIIIAQDGSVTILRLGFTDMLVRNPAEKLAFVADTPAHLRHYLAPEQNDVDASTDPRTDIYTIGSILYELFTGRKIGGFFILPSSVSKLEKRADDLISIALQHSPENRFPTIAEFGTYLTTVRSAEAAAAEQDSRLDEADANDYLTTHTVTGTSPFKRIAAIIVSLLIIAAGCTALYFNFVNDPGPDQALVDRLVAMQELDGTKLTEQELAEKYAEVGEILGEIGPHKASVLIAIRVMQRLGDHEATKKVLDDYINGLPEDTKNIGELKAIVAEYNHNLGQYRAAMEKAALARSTGDDAAELAALEKALTFLPDDCHALQFRSQNPIYLERAVGSALAKARRQLPPGEKFSYSYLVRRGAVDIDLSDNPSFSVLSIFASLPIEEFDLSNTAVEDLSPLAGMSIRKLWLDDSKVTDLSPLVGMPIDTLTFENCAVPDPTTTEQLELLTTVRYTTPSGQREYTIPAPTADKAWENDLGMRFVPLENSTSKLLFSRWETRRMDFGEFVTNAASRLGGEGSQPAEWGDKNTPGKKRLPVSAVSLVDARAFCQWLTSHSQAAGFLPGYARFRIPTDEEWSLAAGIVDHPMLSPAVRALQGAPLVAHTEPGILPVAKTASTPEKIHGLWDNVREWTSTPYDAGVAKTFATRGLYSRPSEESAADVSLHGLYNHPAEEGSPAATIKGDVRTRYPTHATERTVDTGFRIVLDLSGETTPTPSLPALVASGETAAAKKLATAMIENSTNLEAVQAARMYLELEAIESHFKQFRRLPPTLKKHVKYYQGRRYCLVKLPLDWQTAANFSDAIGGHLATLNSTGETAWVVENFTDPHDVTTLWVGATPASENSTTWIWQSSTNTTSLPTAEAPIPPAERLLLLPEQSRTIDGPASAASPSTGGTPTSSAPAPDAATPPSGQQAPAEDPVPSEKEDGPDVWLQAPGHQRHFFLVEWG